MYHQDRKEFIQKLKNLFNINRQIILGGDFNCVENTILDKIGGNPLRPSLGGKECVKLRKDFKLADAFRKLYPNDKCFTFSNNNNNCPIFSRLDRFYVSTNLMPLVLKVFVYPCVLSDHDFITMELKDFDNINFKYGPGYWKLNVSILSNPET